jgi:spermidine/putrescine-binding protein
MAGGAMAGIAAFLAACSGGKGSEAPASVAAGTPAAPGSAAPSEAPSVEPAFSQEPTEGHLWMYNWSDYVDAGNIEEYKKRYAVDDFTYDTYASNEELLTKLQAGAGGQWDVGAPTAEFTPALVQGGFIQKIDWSKVPNAKYIDKQFKGLWWDPQVEYQLPKDWGTTGIAVRTKFVKEDVSLEELLRGRPNYHGKIVIVDSPGDVFVRRSRPSATASTRSTRPSWARRATCSWLLRRTFSPSTPTSTRRSSRPGRPCSG